MSSIIPFLVFLAIGIVQITPTTAESCTAQLLNSSLPCWSGVVSPRTCTSAFLNLDNTEYKSCSTVGLGWWSDSTNNLTLTIETLFTQQRQAYTTNLNNQQLKQFKDILLKFIEY